MSITEEVDKAAENRDKAKASLVEAKFQVTYLRARRFLELRRETKEASVDVDMRLTVEEGTPGTELYEARAREVKAQDLYCTTLRMYHSLREQEWEENKRGT